MRKMIVLGAALAALVLAGCGATATSAPTARPTPTTAAPLTSAQYAARVQALADKADAITHGLPDPHSFGQPRATRALSSLAADWDSAASEPSQPGKADAVPLDTHGRWPVVGAAGLLPVSAAQRDNQGNGPD